MSRSDVDDEEDDDDEEVEYEEPEESEQQSDSRPRLRPTELMFSASGRIALGILGVLLFLGGVAVVSKYAFQEDPKVAGVKKPADEKAAAAKAALANAATETGKGTQNNASGTILPTSGTLVSTTSSESSHAAAFPETNRQPPSKDDRYSHYYEQNLDADVASVDDSPAADPFVDADAAAPSAAPADHTEFDRAPPAVTPVVASPPKPNRQPEPVAPLQASRSYQARAGESLFDIARYELGSAGRWIEIYELNTASLGDQLDSLPAGTRLVIPEQ